MHLVKVFIMLSLLQGICAGCRWRGLIWKETRGVKSPAHLQIHVLDNFWMRFQLSQVGEGELIYEGTEVLVREPLPLHRGKVAFPFALMPG